MTGMLATTTKKDKEKEKEDVDMTDVGTEQKEKSDVEESGFQGGRTAVEESQRRDSGNHAPPEAPRIAPMQYPGAMNTSQTNDSQRASTFYRERDDD
jgi:hypothetical protein